MKILENRALIEECVRPTVFDLGNEVLYKLCSNYPNHNKDDEIIAKVWLIGRAYSVALERNKKKEKEINDTFYLKGIVSVFMNPNLDEKLKELESFAEMNIDSLKKSIEIHGFLTERICKLTEQKNRSFSSKYLHFHFPYFFYIYDSRAVSALRNDSALRKLKIPLIDSSIETDDVDKEYAQFSYKCFHLQKMVFENTGIQLSPRQLDNLLLEISKK